jgi:DNA-binding MarR family transcriptional regulator
MIYNGLRITTKQELIMRILFKFRGMLYDQLIPEVAERLSRDDGKSFRKNTYKDLQALEEMKLIVRDPLKLERTVDFIYLSEAGLELVCELLDISAGYVGSGWNEDWGDFAYDLHRPPKVTSAVIHHHLMLTDVLLYLERQKCRHSYLELDYRDNRYSSFEYTMKGEFNRFRPDAEVLIGTRRYLVEVDRGTEFGEKLREKFRSYSKYLQHLQDMGESLPAGVIFLMNKSTSNGVSRRWSLISATFMNEVQEWSTQFNLIAGSITELQSIISREFNRVNDFNDLYEKMKNYRTETTSVWRLEEGNGISWANAVFSVVKVSESESRFYVYERYEFLETKGLARIHAWWEWYLEAKNRYPEIGVSKYFIPVLWCPEGDPTMQLSFKGFDSEKEFNEAFENRIWMKTKPHPQWFNTLGEHVNIGHPLSRFPL